MADCGGNPLSWGGCVENAGAAAWNWLTTVGSDIGNSWNGLPEWASVTIVITAVAAAIIVTAGAATPELLPGILFFLAGDAGALGGERWVLRGRPTGMHPTASNRTRHIRMSTYRWHEPWRR